MSKEVPKGEEEWTVIAAYTRQDALNDGVLVDVSALAREAGIRYPVAITQRAYAQCAPLPEGVDFQDGTGRIWDMLVILAYYCRTFGTGGTLLFSVKIRNDNYGPKVHQLKAVFHHGDEGEPVITVLLPGED